MRYMVVQDCGCYNVYCVDSTSPDEAKQFVDEGKAVAEHHCGENEVIEVLSEEGIPMWVKPL